MSELKVKDKEIVVPGDEVAVGMDYLPSFGTYRDNEAIIASRLGIVSIDGKVIKIIPLSGKYLPKRGDTVIGQVIDILMSGWRIDINSPYSAMLGLKDATMEFIVKGADLTKWFDIDDYVIAKITNVTSQKLVDLTMKFPGLRKLRGGRIIKVNPYKVPRIIGKAGSMVSMIKQATGCKVLVGQNGLIWIQGDDLAKENLVVETIGIIEKEAHISGLTDRMKEYLEAKTGVKIIPQAPQQENAEFQGNGEQQGEGFRNEHREFRGEHRSYEYRRDYNEHRN